MKTYTVIIDEEGTKFYYNEKGQLHREDGPAVEKLNGYKAWYINGKHPKELELTMTEINKHFGCTVKIVESH